MDTNCPKAYQATAPRTLEQQIMDSTVPKNEREWWAAREITSLRAEVDALRKTVKRYNTLKDAIMSQYEGRHFLSYMNWSPHTSEHGGFDAAIDAAILAQAKKGTEMK